MATYQIKNLWSFKEKSSKQTFNWVTYRLSKISCFFNVLNTIQSRPGKASTTHRFWFCKKCLSRRWSCRLIGQSWGISTMATILKSWTHTGKKWCSNKKKLKGLQTLSWVKMQLNTSKSNSTFTKTHKQTTYLKIRLTKSSSHVKKELVHGT
jgi:hypothetical protein